MLSNHCSQNPNIQTTQFSTLQLSSRSIRLLDKIKPAYCFISQLYLDNNLLITLNGIQQFQNLQVLSINFNQIQTFSELNKITNKFFIKQLAFIGNPFQADLRTSKQYLKANIFVNLRKLNSVQARVYTSRDSYHKHARVISRDIQQYKKQKHHRSQSQQNITQRYKAQQLQGQHTRRQTFKTEIPIHLHTHPLGTHKKHQIKQSKSNKNMINISTTLNKSSAEQSPYFYSYKKQANNRSNNQQDDDQQVAVKPFQTFQQNSNIKQKQSSSKLKKFRKQDIQKNQRYQVEHQYQTENNQQNNAHNQLQQQSEIKAKRYQQISVQLFRQIQQPKESSGLKQQSYNSQQLQQFKRNKVPLQVHGYRNFAIQFLQQQKYLIAQAFHNRYMKQKVFQALAHQKQNTYDKQINIKRKVWGVIKMYNSLAKIQQRKTQS